MSLLLLLVLLLHSRPAAADSCDWPIDLTLERDGHYMDREAAGAGSMTRGRAGNAMIQSITARLAAAAYGGYSTPWDGNLKMKQEGKTMSQLAFSPRFGKLAACYNDGTSQKSASKSFGCPKPKKSIGVPSNKMPRSTAVQGCPSNDAKVTRARRDKNDFLHFFSALHETPS